MPRSNIVYKTHTYDPWSVIQSDYRLDEVAQLYPILIGEFGTGAVMTQSDVDSLPWFGLKPTESRGQPGCLMMPGAPTLLDDRSTVHAYLRHTATRSKQDCRSLPDDWQSI